MISKNILKTSIIKAYCFLSFSCCHYICSFHNQILFLSCVIFLFNLSVFTQKSKVLHEYFNHFYPPKVSISPQTAHQLINIQIFNIFQTMNSQNHYPLSFNPRGQQRYSRVQKQARYVPQFKNQNIQQTPLYRPQPIHDRHYQQQQPQRRHQDYRQLRTNLNPNDSAYLSNKSNYSISRREQSQKKIEDRKKQDIMRRVKQLQEKVLPMVERDHAQQEENLDSGWQSRIQLKLVRIQTCMDGLRKQWEVQMQKKIAQIDSMWQSRFEELVLRAEKTQ